jgi:hypothetical protein
MRHADPLLCREADVFARLLTAGAASPAALDAYVAAHARLQALRPGSAFQQRLVRHAARGVFHARSADGYARLFDPHGPLRRKLVLMLAILESTPPTHRLLDSAVGGSFATAAPRLVAYGLRGVFCTAIGTLWFWPLRLFLGERP